MEIWQKQLISRSGRLKHFDPAASPEIVPNIPRILVHWLFRILQTAIHFLEETVSPRLCLLYVEGWRVLFLYVWFGTKVVSAQDRQRRKDLSGARWCKWSNFCNVRIVWHWLRNQQNREIRNQIKWEDSYWRFWVFLWQKSPLHL